MFDFLRNHSALTPVPHPPGRSAYQLNRKSPAFLIQLEAQQEFTHVATPEENAYIEAFHSILQRELIERYEFSSFYEAKLHLEKYMARCGGAAKECFKLPPVSWDKDAH